MKDPSGSIRTWLFGILDENVSYGGSDVPVYSFAPKDATMPYILLGGQSSPGEEGPKDAYISTQNFTVEVYTSNLGNDGSYIPCDTIASSILQLVRLRTAITISGYNVISLTFDNMITDAIDVETEIVIYKIMYFTMIIEEN